MGRHRADESQGAAHRDPITGEARARRGRLRGIAGWPIVAATLAVLLVLGWLGWNWAETVATNSARAQASGCPEGAATLRVVVTPDIEAPVAAAARNWNRTGHVVHAHCVHATVHAIPPGKVLDAVTGKSAAAIGGLPAAWVPDSTQWLTRLHETNPGVVGASGVSIATAGDATYPYAGLTGEGVSATQARAAQSFRAYLLREQQRPAFNQAGFGPPHVEQLR